MNFCWYFPLTIFIWLNLNRCIQLLKYNKSSEKWEKFKEISNICKSKSPNHLITYKRDNDSYLIFSSSDGVKIAKFNGTDAVLFQNLSGKNKLLTSMVREEENLYLLITSTTFCKFFFCLLHYLLFKRKTKFNIFSFHFKLGKFFYGN